MVVDKRAQECRVLDSHLLRRNSRFRVRWTLILCFAAFRVRAIDWVILHRTGCIPCGCCETEERDKGTRRRTPMHVLSSSISFQVEKVEPSLVWKDPSTGRKAVSHSRVLLTLLAAFQVNSHQPGIFGHRLESLPRPCVRHQIMNHNACFRHTGDRGIVRRRRTQSDTISALQCSPTSCLTFHVTL